MKKYGLPINLPQIAKYDMKIINQWSKYLFIFLLLSPMWSHGQNLESILERHFEAIGQENLVAMRSIVMEAREMEGFSSGKKYSITKKYPNKMRIEGKWQERVYVKAFDGTRAWTIAPWTGVHTAQLMTDRERNLFLVDVGIGSPLYDYGLGNVLNLIGSERADDANHYVIRSTTNSGFYVDYLIDKKSYMIHLVRIYEEDQIDKVAYEVIYKNYKNLGGVSIPFGFEKRIDRSVTSIVIDDIVFGQGASNSIFNKPE
ncbi:hypothetical protein [Reichenbachiella sp.]|uniref:hypothetical protein n=1 Tax=Reichenbachiella sp. TaxID=2184521 RepID=UPI003BB07E44